MSVVIMICNLKGGVAKTTNSVALAECMASQHYRTLLIDADHQCTASELVIGEQGLWNCEKSRQTLHDMLADLLDDDFDEATIDKFIIDKVSNIGDGLPNLSLLPCSYRIDDFNTNMAKARRGFHTNDEFLQKWRSMLTKLKKRLMNRFDIVLIDCPPSIALQVKALLQITDAIIVPSVPDRLSIRGTAYLNDRLRNFTRIKWLGTIWSLYRQQNHMHVKFVEKWDTFPEKLREKIPAPFNTVIPNAAKIAESSEPDITHTNFRHKYGDFAKKFEALCGEIIHRCEKAGFQLLPQKEINLTN